MLDKGRLPFDSDFWWDYFMGTFILTVIVWGVWTLVLLKPGPVHNLQIPLLLVIIALVSVKFYTDHKIQIFDTKLSAKENADLIGKALDSLAWKYKKQSASIYLEYDKYILKWTRVRLIPLDGRVVYNFQYQSSRVGRLPIFIGIRTYLQRKFERALYEVIAQRSTN